MLSMACALAASFWHSPYLESVTGNVGCPLPPIQCGMTAFSVFLLPANLLLEQVTERKVRVLGSYFSVFGNQSIVGV